MSSHWKAVATVVRLVCAAILMAGVALAAPKSAAPTQAEWEAIDWNHCDLDSLAADWAVRYPKVKAPDAELAKAWANLSPDSYSIFDKPPKVSKLAKPAYPRGASACAREGDVWVKVLVGVDGKVWNAVVYKFEGYRSSPFDKVALDAARKGIWKPALLEGKIVPVWAAYQISFVSPDKRYSKLASEYCDSIARLNAKYTDLDKAPIPWDIKDAPCPDGAKKKDCNKGVWVRVLVGVDGTVTDAELMNSDDKDTPEGSAALQAARQGVWEPAEKDGKKVEAWVAYKSEFE